MSEGKMIIEFPQKWARKSNFLDSDWMRTAKEFLGCRARQASNATDPHSSVVVGKQRHMPKATKKRKRKLFCAQAAKERLMPRGFGYVLLPMEPFENALNENFLRETLPNHQEGGPRYQSMHHIHRRRFTLR